MTRSLAAPWRSLAAPWRSLASPRSLAPARALALTACALVLAACGSSSSHAGAGRPELTVSAAASLKSAFTRYGAQFSTADVRFSFAGSDMLAAQIEQGVKPDVFASANLELPEMLHSKGLVSNPVPFAANELVLAVPAGSTKVKSLADAENPGVSIAIGSPTVPIGSYTRTVLERLGPQASAKVLANVRSQEADVSGIVGKLTEGAVDAGFTYLTDVIATHGKLRALALPSRLQPVVAYGISVVNGSGHATQARRFIDGLLRGPGRADLLSAGFLPPPK